jgi:hypothetical protein
MYICIYKYIPLYKLKFWFQCIKQYMNQFRSTQRSATAVGYVELRWSAVSNNLSSTLQQFAFFAETKCSLSPVAAVCLYLFVSFDSVWAEEEGIAKYYIYRTVPVIPTCWQNDTKNVINLSTLCALCSTLSVTLFPTRHLPSVSLIIVLTFKVTVPILQETVRDAQRYTAFIA